MEWFLMFFGAGCALWWLADLWQVRREGRATQPTASYIDPDSNCLGCIHSTWTARRGNACTMGMDRSDDCSQWTGKGTWRRGRRGV